MRTFKFDRNVRFSFLLPYGFTSTSALLLAVPVSDTSFVVYDPNVPIGTREQICQANYQSRLRAIRRMLQLGYIEECRKRVGVKSWETITMYRLTKSGLFFLTNTPNEALEEERKRNIPGLKNRNKKEISYTPTDPQYYANRQQLYEIAKLTDPTEEDLRTFRTLFLESVEYDNISILATEPYLAESVQVNTTMRSNALYRSWKISNIEALFKANNYLTQIDRRHLQTPKRVRANETRPMDIYDFCCYTLDRWYDTHKDAFLYLLPLEHFAEKVEPSWRETPAFYPIAEIDDAVIEIETEEEINEKKTTRSYRNMCVGVAVGREKNYIVHHTRNSGTPWEELIEKSTIGSVQMRINNYAENNQTLGANRSIYNAIMIVTNVPQFVSLFTQAKSIDKEGRRKYRIGAPYDAVCLIPVSPAGMMQLRGLMESSPINFERAIANYLLQFDGFARRSLGPDPWDSIFPLTYKGVPVLIGHTMNWQVLHYAKGFYEEGRKFYVSCYPEQAKYIRAIMPDVEIL